MFLGVLICVRISALICIDNGLSSRPKREAYVHESLSSFFSLNLVLLVWLKCEVDLVLPYRTSLSIYFAVEFFRCFCKVSFSVRIWPIIFVSPHLVWSQLYVACISSGWWWLPAVGDSTGAKQYVSVVFCRSTHDTETVLCMYVAVFVIVEVNIKPKSSAI